MIKLKTKDNEFNICSEWKDISYGQYIDVLFILNDKWEKLDKTIKIISAVSDKPKELEDYLYNEFDLEDLNSLTKNVKWIDDDKKGFEKAAYKAKPVQNLEIDGKKYVIKSQYHRKTLGEMIALEQNLKNPDLHPEEIALGILIRELDENGNEKKFSTETFDLIVSELKYKINLLDTYNYVLFFSNGVKKSIKGTKGYSITKI